MVGLVVSAITNTLLKFNKIIDNGYQAADESRELDFSLVRDSKTALTAASNCPE